MLELDYPMMFWSAVTFGVLFVLLMKYAFPPIIKMMDERKDEISMSIEAAKQAQEEAHKALATYKEKINEANQTAEKIIKQAHQETVKAQEDIMAQAKKEAHQVIKDAQAGIAREKDHMITQLREELSGLITSAATKVLGKTVTAKDNEKIIEESINDIKSL